ncbi:MAG: protein kinase [Deltaproteobacteria bacterium]|nr:protein kinase [Deltaproteobacteria bacterium]
MECLDANTVQDLMAGALDSGPRQDVLAHIDTCEDCRELLSVMGRDTERNRVADTLRGVGAKSTKDLALDETAMPETVGTGPAADHDDALAATMAPTDLYVPPARIGGKAPSAGGTLGRFLLEEKLGAGAMGVVWRAHDPKLGRDVALKLLRHADESLTERLVREARSMAQVSHPNVVTVFEVGEAAGQSFIAMELVVGKSLRQWQASEKRSVPEIVEHYLAAAAGLAAAHARGIIHRDFKPDNVLVGSDGRVRVTDFGLAAAKPGESGKLAPHAIADVNLTTSGSVLGTPAYMAPEQFVGGNVDPRTDQFNFCVALYEALYGERPFEGRTFEELGDNVSGGKVKPPPAGTRVSGTLRALVLKGMSVAPGDRFPNMDALIVELGRDRAKPWRRTAVVSAVLAGVLAIGLVADFEVRERLGGQIRQSFELTGNQLANATERLRKDFELVARAANHEPALREVTSHHDQADFGLGTPEADLQDLERLHNSLAQVEWIKLGGDVAVGDYKGRLLYTSAAPQTWNTDLSVLPDVKRALAAGGGDAITLIPYGNRELTATGMLGPRHDGLVIIAQRTVSLGESTGSEARALFFDIKDGKQFLDELQLDKDAAVALVAPDGTSIGGMPAALIDAAPANQGVANVQVGGDEYEVQMRMLPDLGGKSIGRVVMARPIKGVLSLFPGARIVFAAAMLLSLALAAFSAWRARQMTGARTA